MTLQRSLQLKAALLSLLTLGTPRLASAASYALDFTDADVKVEGDLVWNFVQRLIHPPLQVYQYKLTFVSPDAYRPFNVGDGSDGAFQPSTYVRFSNGGNLSGNIIRMNSDTEWQFTSFSLAAGWTIRPEGTGALIIRSLSTIEVSGTIDCAGGAGEDYSGSPTLASQGGTARCGGGDGGDGAYVSAGTTIPAQDGFVGGELIPNGVSPGVPGPTAGEGATGDSSGGGGGAGYTAALQGVGVDAEDGNGDTPGLAGAQVQDDDFQYSGGGFGGGGGSHYDAGGAAQNSAGAGGGAGGGNIEMTAVSFIAVYSGGLVDASGGAGGGDGGGGAAIMAGGGGGGAGGSIAMFAGGEVMLGGLVTAAGGAGAGNAGFEGGRGSVGRTWVVGLSGFSIGVGLDPVVPEFPATLLSTIGLIRYQTGTFTLDSAAVDMASSRPEATDIDVTSTISAGGSVDLFFASGSDESFTPDWVALASLPKILERYFKLRVVITNADEANPTTVTALSMEATPFLATDFKFEGGCARVSGGGTPPSGFWWLSLLMPFFALLWLRRRA